MATDIEESWQTLVDLKQTGKIRCIAVSNFNVAEMSRAQAIAPISSLQEPYSPIRPGIETVSLPYARPSKSASSSTPPWPPASSRAP